MFEERIIGKIKSGKEFAYGLKKAGDPLCSIYFKGGGAVPEALGGFWNDLRKATKAVEQYINKETLTPKAQEVKEFKKGVAESKKRPSKLTVKPKEEK